MMRTTYTDRDTGKRAEVIFHEYEDQKHANNFTNARSNRRRDSRSVTEIFRGDSGRDAGIFRDDIRSVHKRLREWQKDIGIPTGRTAYTNNGRNMDKTAGGADRMGRILIYTLLEFQLHGNTIVVSDTVVGRLEVLQELAHERGYYLVDKVDDIWVYQSNEYPNNKLHISH